jgi:hypothetical protein
MSPGGRAAAAATWRRGRSGPALVALLLVAGLGACGPRGGGSTSGSGDGLPEAARLDTAVFADSATALIADTDTAAIAGSDGLAVAETSPAQRRLPGYRAEVVAGATALARLRAALGPAGFATLLKVNRRDAGHVRSGDTLVVPDSITMALDSTARMLALSPFPLRIGSAPPGKLMLVSLRVQAFAAYDSGTLVRWGPTSTGRRAAQTPVGLYHANWKSRRRVSTVNREWLLEWCVNLESLRGISLHRYELPGRPASHSCVRLLEDDAIWIHGWVGSWRLGGRPGQILEHGTPVVIFGSYAYDARPPWTLLPADSTATIVPPAEVADALAPHLAELSASRPSP